MLNGGLDIQTPSVWARDFASKLGAELVEFPFVGHGVDISLSSPVTANDASCSLDMLRAFIDDPSSQVDDSCARTAYTPDVAGRTDIMKYLAIVLYGKNTPLLGADDDDAPKAKRLHPQSGNETLAGVELALRESLTRAARSLRLR